MWRVWRGNKRVGMGTSPSALPPPGRPRQRGHLRLALVCPSLPPSPPPRSALPSPISSPPAPPVQATKEAEHRERLQDLLSRIASLNERIAVEENSRHKWADR